MMTCPDCEKQAKVVMYGIHAPTWVCLSCDREVEEPIECPECEERSLLERADGNLKCVQCGHEEEGVCKDGGCSL